jgi:anti-sigma factor RsiW
MKCMLEVEESEELIVAYGARTLNPETAAAFERHLHVCDACREAGEMQRAVWAALDQWRDLVLSLSFDRTATASERQLTRAAQSR